MLVWTLPLAVVSAVELGAPGQVIDNAASDRSGGAWTVLVALAWLGRRRQRTGGGCSRSKTQVSPSVRSSR